MRTVIKTLSGLFLVLLVSTNVWADERVLTIYFHGTGFRLNETFKGLSGPGLLGDSPNLISTLYNDDDSMEIPGKYNDNPLSLGFAMWVPEPIEDEGTHYKFNVNGAGTYASSTFLDVMIAVFNIDDILGKIDPNLGARNWVKINQEALDVLNKVNEKHGDDDVILNLVGFSRGGVSALKFAKSAAENSRVKKINILNYDPVPGNFDPVLHHGEYFKLNDKVNEYVGIYAEDERSYMFEPILPQTTSFNTRTLTVRVPGSHETMVGNIQVDGHATTLNDLDDLQLQYVSHVSRVIAEQLLKSNEWGNVPLAMNTDLGIAGVDEKEEFTDILKDMEDNNFWYPGMQFVSFIPLNLLSGVDLCFTNKHSYELRSIGVGLPSRLCFRGTDRGAPGWQKGWCWFWPVNFIWPERVYWLEEEVPRISSNTWDQLQALREERKPAPPFAIVPHNPELPVLNGQCSATITNRPKAYVVAPGTIDLLNWKFTETIKGTTADPLDYSEQGGPYEVHWTYEWAETAYDPFWPSIFWEDGPSQPFEHNQMIMVEDTIPPQPESPFLPTVTGVGMAEVTSSPTAEDNCSGPVTGTTFDSLAYSTSGTHDITWRYEDSVGNTNSQIQKVIVYPTNDLEVGSVGKCMRECAQTVNPSTHDKWGNDISAGEFTLDCVNYCNPKLKKGYCSPKMDGCCNVMYQEADWDCWAMAGEVCTETADCAMGLGCYMSTCEAPLGAVVEGANCRPGLDQCQAGYVCQQLPDECTGTNDPDPNYYCMDPDYSCME